MKKSGTGKTKFRVFSSLSDIDLLMQKDTCPSFLQLAAEDS